MENTNTPQTQKQKPTIAGQWIDVLPAGTHKSMDGKTISFTAEDLAQMVANTKVAQAPAVLGHPKHNDPAYGWTTDAKVENGHLFVKFSDVNPDFDKGVQSGAYRNRSVSVFNDPKLGWRLRHVGWLGAAPPAIDGLAPVSFAAEDECEVFEFAAMPVRVPWALELCAEALRGIREDVIAERGIEAADRVIPTYRIDSILSVAADLRSENDTTSFTTTTGETMTTFTQEQLDDAVAAARAEEQQKTAEFSAQLEAQRQATITAEAKSKVDALVREGKLLPAQAASAVEFAKSLAGTQTFEFAAADGNTKQQSPAEWFWNFMASQPKKIAIGEKTETDNSANTELSADELSKRISSFIKDQADKGITVSYAEAAKHVAAV